MRKKKTQKMKTTKRTHRMKMISKWMKHSRSSMIQFFLQKHLFQKTSFSMLFLRRSWVSNHATATHVRNKIMTHRFIQNKHENDRIVTAENCDWKIQSYEHIKIKRQKKFEIKEMILWNVCYIFEFITNLISKHILLKKDVYFMTEIERLYRNKKTSNCTKKKNNQFYIENNDYYNED